ncbi:MAG: ATP synthase F1 subunit epsilon [Clostridia bacterium]|nr:ATP synthase F1 subunit epsilon [Clostridia bacterium]NCC44003.1 ATP synthase F1 subunit epsilon [Clostridia bacterium]
MNSSFYVSILASDHVFYKGRAETIIFPTYDGELALLPHHADTIISIIEGDMRFRSEDGTWHEAIVGRGFAQMINNRVTVLVDTAEKPEEIDVKRAEEAKERAEEQLRQKQSMQEYYVSKASLARAMTRLRATSDTRGRV